MADVMIFAIAIASAVSLLIVSPHEARERALRALRAYGEAEALPPAVVARLRKTSTGYFHLGFGGICSRGDTCPTDAEYGLQIKCS